MLLSRDPQVIQIVKNVLLLYLVLSFALALDFPDLKGLKSLLLNLEFVMLVVDLNNVLQRSLSLRAIMNVGGQDVKGITILVKRQFLGLVTGFNFAWHNIYHFKR